MMNKVLMILTAVILMMAAGLGGYYFGRKGPSTVEEPVTVAVKDEKKIKYYVCPMDPTIISDKPGTSPCGMPFAPVYEDKAEPTKEKKIKYWMAPMDPTYIRNEPGKSPMGMDLVPVYEEEEKSAEGAVRIDPVTVQNMGVRTAPVERRKMTRSIRTVGVVAYDEKRVTQVQSKVEGWIEKLYVDFTGQFVKKDDMLLEIYSPQLVSSQEEYLAALEFRDKMKQSPYPEIASGADSLLASAKKRLDYLDVPKHQIKEIKEGRKVLKALHIHSPNKGVVINKHIQEGAYVKPGMPLYTLADISKVWVHADIYEYELPWVKVGQEVVMTLSYFPGRLFKGKVAYIYPYLEAKTRTVKVRLEFDNPNWDLKPDMYANIKIDSVISGDDTAVPAEAVIHSGERKIVVLDIGDGKFLPMDIQTGIESGDGFYQVLDGLKAGDSVVVSAQFLIDSESRLKEAISKMLEARRGEVGDGDSPDSTASPVNQGQSPDDIDMSDVNMDDMDMSDMRLE